jgi:hypothetical protein
MSWQDRSFQHTDEAQYPFIQWVNSGGNLNPRAEKGGFAAPMDQGITIPGIFSELHHRNGESTEVIYTPELTVAVITTRFAWIKDGMRLPSYRDGARGKLQVLCYVQSTEGEPPVVAMLTFTGIPSRSFSNARKAFSNSVAKATKRQAPAWAFWMTVHAGEVKMVGTKAQSPITTVELVREVDPDRDYVGDDLADEIEELLIDEAKAWREAWVGGGTNGEGAFDDSADVDADALAAVMVFPLPNNGKGYTTIGNAITANDAAWLKEVMDWAKSKGKADLASACKTAIAVLAGNVSTTPEEEGDIPF